MECKKEDRIFQLQPSHSQELAPLYIRIFEAYPWLEQFQCLCGEGPFFVPKDYEKECDQISTNKVFPIDSSATQRCHNCDELLEESVSPIFSLEGVVEDYLSALRDESFLGFGLRKYNRLAGFCFGKSFPLEDDLGENSTQFREAGNQFKTEHRIDLSRTFYHGESGTDPLFQGNGLGTKLLEKLIYEARKKDDYIVFRTINRAMVTCYENVLGLERGELLQTPAFKDPDSKKRQVWYFVKLRDN